LLHEHGDGGVDAIQHRHVHVQHHQPDIAALQALLGIRLDAFASIGRADNLAREALVQHNIGNQRPQQLGILGHDGDINGRRLSRGFGGRGLCGRSLAGRLGRCRGRAILHFGAAVRAHPHLIPRLENGEGVDFDAATNAKSGRISHGPLD